MRINIKTFGKLQDFIKSGEVETDVTTTNDLIEQLSTNKPELKQFLFRVALNNKIINESTLLKEGDEIALLSAFSGG